MLVKWQRETHSASPAGARETQTRRHLSGERIRKIYSGPQWLRDWWSDVVKRPSLLIRETGGHPNRQVSTHFKHNSTFICCYQASLFNCHVVQLRTATVSVPTKGTCSLWASWPWCGAARRGGRLSFDNVFYFTSTVAYLSIGKGVITTSYGTASNASASKALWCHSVCGRAETLHLPLQKRTHHAKLTVG